ncbi:hypothetical protein PREVCOP_04329 [Segatella copri DSM 18205]|uniref:Uncharacterized protein n=1 Tax=Segatella copri DSM 18205 TaxID=537011 RepID=D1PAV5_9BACT|nr:hypothetical protein PREVCOP_04329 [Segatella copri DSM 18205]
MYINKCVFVNKLPSLALTVAKIHYFFEILAFLSKKSCIFATITSNRGIL